MSYFTKGPWEIKYDEEYGNHTIRMGTALENRGNFEPQHEIRYEHGCWVDEDEGEEYPGNRQAREAKANALLIACAPDMFEVLKLYEEFEAELIMENESWTGGLPKFTQRLYDKWMEIQGRRNDALAKAQGLEDKA